MPDNLIHPSRRDSDPKPVNAEGGPPSLRQRYACAALGGMLSNPTIEKKFGASHPDNNLDLARAAFALADAMMKAELE